LQVLNAAIRTFEEKRAKPGALLEALQPQTNEEAQELVFESATDCFKKEDPSQYYTISKRIGTGGFSRVFLVKRNADDFECALKFVEPQNK
jgi:serine/threonine protein kinase